MNVLKTNMKKGRESYGAYILLNFFPHKRTRSTCSLTHLLPPLSCSIDDCASKGHSPSLALQA